MSTSCQMPGWMKHKLESILLGEISITSDMQMTPPLCTKWRGTKKPLDESDRGEWKVGLKLNIQKTKIMASGPITSWQIDGETMETLRDFIFLGSKITADGDCSHKIKRCLLFGRKAMTNLSSVQFSRSVMSNSLQPMNCSMPGLPVHHHLPEFTETHVHRVSDAIQPSHPLSSPSPPASNPSEHQGLFQWVNSSHELAKVLEFQL